MVGHIPIAGNNQSKSYQKIKHFPPPISLYPHIQITLLKPHTVIPARDKNSNSLLSKQQSILRTTWRRMLVHSSINGTLPIPQGIHTQNNIRKKSDTVYFPSKQFNMPNISSTNATIHAAQSLINAEHNSAPESPLVTLGN